MTFRKGLYLSMLLVAVVVTWAVVGLVFGQGAAVVEPVPTAKSVSANAEEPADRSPIGPAAAAATESSNVPSASWSRRYLDVGATTGRRTGAAVVPSPGATQPSSTRSPYGYGGSSRGDTAYYIYNTRKGPRDFDPELAKLLQEDDALEQQAEVLADQCRKEKDEKKRTELRTALEELTKQHFDLRQKRRQQEIAQLEKQLERIKASIQKRSQAKDLIIQRRIARLLGEEDDLAF